MARITGAALKYPARAGFVAYLSFIAVGTVVLLLPVCHAEDRPPLTPVQAAFTATSAVCVTGLTVRSTPHDLSLVGQVVVLLLFQIGGIGILTITTYATIAMRRQRGLRQQLTVLQTVGARPTDDLSWVLRKVLITVLTVEGIGFAILTARNLMEPEMPAPDAVWHAAFHSVSAFCNAGFALHDDSLVPYQGDLTVNLTIAALIIIGGVGSPVWVDLRRNWAQPWRNLWGSLTLHTRLVLFGTVGLLAIGTLAFLALEQRNVLADLPLGKQLLVCFFQSTTCRTAGFNTVDTASLTNASLFVSMLLMVIGAAPCSTGGGFKVSTAMVLAAVARSKFQGLQRTRFGHRTISEENIDRSLAAVMLFALVGVAALTILLTMEQARFPHAETRGSFLGAAFEVVSALGTVGLSMGMTTELSDGGQLLLMLLMFIGRLGPISVFVVLSRARRETRVAFPKEEVLIG